jgi:hypothetical protein
MTATLHRLDSAGRRTGFCGWLENVRRVLEDEATMKHDLSERELFEAYSTGVKSHYAAWYLATGKAIGGLELVLDASTRKKEAR